MIFLRQKYKHKSQQWGPFSRVQSSLFHNLESIFGIDHQSCALALPMWGPGDQKEYSKNNLDLYHYNTQYKNCYIQTVLSNDAYLSFSTTSMTASKGSILVRTRLDAEVTKENMSVFSHPYYTTNNRIYCYAEPTTENLIVRLGSSPSVNVGYTMIPGRIVDLCLKWDNGQFTVFVDGVLLANGNYAGLTDLYSPFYIGCTGNLSGPTRYSNYSYFTFLTFSDVVSKDQAIKFHDNPDALWQRVAPISYYFLVGGSGGTVFDVSCLDGFNFNDAISRNAIFSAVANETLSLSSSPGNIGNFLTSALSQISMTGSTSTRMILLGNAADLIGVGDVSSALNAITCLVSDNMNLSDSASSEGIFQGSADDSLSLADAVVNSLITQGIINEIVNLSDAASLGAFIDAFVNDQINISDGTVNVASLVAAIQDNINLSDSVTAIIQALASASDTISLSDLSAWGAVQQALAASGLSLTDSAAANLQLFAQSADSITFDDDSHMTAVFNVAVNDAVSFAETISKIALFQASVADSARFSATAMEVSTLPNGKISVSFDMKIPGIGFDMKTATITFNLI